MKATSLFVSATRIPTCQSATYPGGLRALRKCDGLAAFLVQRPSDSLPLDKVCSIVEPERRVLVLDVVMREKIVDLLELQDEDVRYNPASRSCIAYLCRARQVHRHPAEVLVEFVRLLSNRVDGLVGLERAFANLLHHCRGL